MILKFYSHTATKTKFAIHRYWINISSMFRFIGHWCAFHCLDIDLFGVMIIILDPKSYKEQQYITHSFMLMINDDN